MLPAANRLRSKRDFKLVYRRGRSYVHPMLVLHVLPNRAEESRIGFSISKKLGGSVQRNRIKRRLREIVRTNAVKLRPGFDVILVGRSPLKDSEFAAIRNAVGEVFHRARLFESAAESP